MKIPFSYTWRSLWARRLTTVLTVGGITLVAFVFAAVLMLARGLEETLVETGSEDNAIVLRKSAGSELVSQIERDGANVIRTHPEIALLSDGKPFVSSETCVIINLLKKESKDMGNITVRGVSPPGLQLRPQVTLAEGRWFTFGSTEIVVGASIAKRFLNATTGDTPVDAKSIIMVLTLGVLQNHEISIAADGLDEEAAIQSLSDLVASNFGEI